MSAVDALKPVADRLVGGMMFHSEHANICLLHGLRKLARHHEDGFASDSHAFREVHSETVRHTGFVLPDGDQKRQGGSSSTGACAWSVTSEQAAKAARETTEAWVEWESGTVSVYMGAYKRLWDMGEPCLAALVLKLAEDTQDELAGARGIMQDMMVADFDCTYIADKYGRDGD